MAMPIHLAITLMLAIFELLFKKIYQIQAMLEP
jgi:hypothetical protein